MTRALAFLVRNWPLKLAAVVMAVLLYVALVLAQNVQAFPGSVPIEPLRLPSNAVLVEPLPNVTNIRYLAPGDVAARLTRDSFRATIDLGDASPTPENPFVNVSVRLQVVPEEGVQILDYSPQRISVQLDPLSTRIVPVDVEWGDVPPGLQVGIPELSVDQATVSGADSVVRLATAAQARVVIQPSGIDVNQDVPLVVVDALGNPLRPVDVEPASVEVKIAVASRAESKSLPVHPVVTGTPPAGVSLVGVAVEPAVVSVSGDADVLAELLRVDTAPVSILGATGDIVRLVDLELPDGVTALGPTTVTVRLTLQTETATRTFSAGLVLEGARDDRTYALSTDRVLVTLGGAVGEIDRLTGASFTVKLDVSGLGPGTYQVAVSATLPAGIAVVAASPSTVTVTVAIPSTPTPEPSPAPSPSGP